MNLVIFVFRRLALRKFALSAKGMEKSNAHGAKAVGSVATVIVEHHICAVIAAGQVIRNVISARMAGFGYRHPLERMDEARPG